MGTDDLLWRHLKGVPAFRALLRAVESRFYQDFDLPRPVLDLGCGDGHFSQATFASPPEVGVDPWRGPLQEARGRGVYQLPLQAAGGRLPFADGQFGSVISNSVLEHIPEVDSVVREAARVLGPGGTLVITMPSENFAHFLSISSALRQVGLDVAAAGYEGWFNHISRHQHCDPPAVWHERLAAAGLRTVRWQYYFSPRALRRLEWGHYLGLPAVVSKLLFGRWIIAPWRSSLQWAERWLRPCYNEPPPERGAYLLFIAQRTLPDEEIGPLPSPRPRHYPIPEPAAAPAVQPTPVPVAVAKAKAPSTALPPPAPRPPSPPAVKVKSVVWLALAALFAILGQISWNWKERPFEPGNGFTWYGLALLALAIFIWQSAPRRRPAMRPISLSLGASFQWLRGQLALGLILFWSLTLSWLAWMQAQDALQPPGSPVVALLFWMAGIGLAILAFWPGGIEGLLRLEARLLPRLRRRAPGGETPPRRRLDRKSWERWEIIVVVALVLAAFLLRFVKLDEIPYVLAGDEASMGREAARVLSGEIANPFVTGWFSHPTLFFFILALPIKLFGHTAFAARFLSPFVGALTVLATYLFARRAWGRPVALVAAGLLAGYHFHIHYSRLALNNTWDPLFALLVMGLLWRGWQSGDRRYYIVGGLGLGISQYFYMGSRMLLVMMAALTLYWLLTNPRRAWEQRATSPRMQGGNLAVVLVIALVIGLPIALFSIGHPDDYMARVNQLGIYQSGWLEREVVITGRSAGELLWEQFWKSALAFNYTVDPTFWYRPDIPLLRFWPSILFVFGLGLALVGIKKTPNFLLLLWIGATVIFAGVLLENPPSSQRYVIAAPAACLLVALALVWMGERLRGLLGGRKEVWLGGVLALALWMAWGDVHFYFGDYTPNGDFGGLNTEVAQRTADYLLDLGPEWETYFFGPPRMGISPRTGFPSVPFLVPDANSVDVLEPLGDLSELEPIQLPAVFIFLPERATEMEMIRSAFPHGTEKHFPGRNDRPLFIAYEAP